MDSRSSSLLNYTKNRKLTNITFHLLTLCNLCCTFSHLYLTSNNSSVLKLVYSFTPYHLSLRVKAGKNCCFSKWYCHPFQVKQTYTDNGDVAWLYYCGWSDPYCYPSNSYIMHDLGGGGERLDRWIVR